MSSYTKALGQAESLLNKIARDLMLDRHYEEAKLAITAIEALEAAHAAICTAGIEERSMMRDELDRIDTNQEGHLPIEVEHVMFPDGVPGLAKRQAE